MLPSRQNVQTLAVMHVACMRLTARCDLDCETGSMYMLVVLMPIVVQGPMQVCGMQGTHTAMKSGMLAAEAAFTALTGPAAQQSASQPVDLSAYEAAVKSSWIWEELTRSRNIRPG